MTSAGTYTYEIGYNPVMGVVTRARGGKKGVQGFLSVDPLTHKFASQSPYQFAGNNPIQFVDVQGQYKLDPKLAAKYPRLAKLLSTAIPEVMKDRDVAANLMVTGRLSRDGVKRFSEYDEGPMVSVAKLTSDADREAGLYVNGYTTARNGRGEIQLDQGLIDALANATTQEELDAASLAITSTLLHETAHHGPIEESDRFNSSTGIKVGPYKRSLDPSGQFENFSFNGEIFGTTKEEGDALETGVYILRSGLDPTDVNELNKQGPNSVKDMGKLRNANSGSGALPQMSIESEDGGNRP